MALMRGLSPILKAGENAVVEVHRDLSGGARIVIRDRNNPTGVSVIVSKQIAVTISLSLLEAVGFPVQEEIGRRMIEANGPPLT